MDYEYLSQPLVDRGDPIPVPPGVEDAEASRDASKQAPEPPPTPEKVPKSASLSLQDRLFARLFEQLIPPAEDDQSDDNPVLGGPPSQGRPGFSLAVMSTNFRRFNARIGVVFVFQAKAIGLFSWQTPSHTLSFLAVYSFLCIYPYLLLAIPICLILLFVMVPAYLARHPPPPTEDAGPDAQAMALSGPALAPPRVVKPAPELSQDFFRNMRDLQNSMADFATLHDAVLAALTPWTNFADESRASAAFLVLTVSAVGIVLVAPLLPFRAIALVGGWALIGSSHPKMQQLTADLYTKDRETALSSAESQLQKWVNTDFEVEDAPEILEVEIFELQRRRQTTSYTSTFAPPMAPSITAASSPATDSEYESWLYSPTPWEPQTPARRAGARPKGTRFFEDVKPPAGWEWAGKKWVLDPGGEGIGEDWVAARLLRGLEVEPEGERWVYDLVDIGADEAANAAKAKKAPRSISVDENDREALVFRGEWRRRRWVRSVRRVKVQGGGEKVMSDASGGPVRGTKRAK